MNNRCPGQQCGHPDHVVASESRKPRLGFRQSPISEQIGIRAESATAMPNTGSRSSSPGTSMPARSANTRHFRIHERPVASSFAAPAI
jgi:hypothetical protein